MGILNNELDEQLMALPDQVADMLFEWRKASLVREKIEAILYLKFKGEDKDRSATEIKAMVHADLDRYHAVLAEAKIEADYERLYERLMSFKKRADLRTAF